MALKKISTFAERLKEAIGNRKNIEVAENIGISKQAISMYLSGARHPVKPVIEALANELNVSPMWLMGYDVPKFQPKKEKQIDISNEINNVIDLMKQQEGLMFCGKPMDEKTKTLVKMALEHAINIAIEMDKKDKQNN